MKKHTLIALVVALLAASARAEFFTSTEYSWSLDLPEGFYVSESSPDGLSHAFEHEFFETSVAVQLLPLRSFKNSAGALDYVLQRLGARGDKDDFLWNNRECAISNFKFTMNGKEQSGWAITLPLNSKKRCYIAVIAHTRVSGNSGAREQVIMSALDSLALERSDMRKPGPVTAYAYNSTETEHIEINFPQGRVFTKLPREASEAARFVIDREFSILAFYANRKNWREAWRRYYRNVFREAYSRLDDAARDIHKALYPDALKKNRAQPYHALAQSLLTWTQGFEYKRGQNLSDFNDLPSVLQNKGSDCDSRALLLCVLLEHYGVGTKFFVSREYSHALLGVNLPGKGARIVVDGTSYLLGETTARVDIGLVASEHSDTNKWIDVDLP